jgi:hypothetical protein
MSGTMIWRLPDVDLIAAIAHACIARIPDVGIVRPHNSFLSLIVLIPQRRTECAPGSGRGEVLQVNVLQLSEFVEPARPPSRSRHSCPMLISLRR